MKFLIVGGGPVGLFMAIKLIEKFGKKAEIKLYEKRRTYSRTQIILFQPYLLKKILPIALSEMISEHVCHGTRAAYDDYGYCFKNSMVKGQNLITITINDLEIVLFKYLDSKAIKENAGSFEIVRKKFIVGGTSNKDLKWADIVIGADSKKSLVREKLLKAEFIEHPQFTSYGLAMTFEDKSNPKYFIKFDDKLSKAIRRIELNEPSVAQHRRRFFRSKRTDKGMGNGNYTYLGLQVNPDEFAAATDKMNEHGDAEFTFSALPANLKSVIREHLEYYGSEPVELDSVKVFVFKIKLAHSETFARVIDDKAYFVIGDAAIQSHFFTAFGINSGFAEVQNFVDIIENYAEDDDGLNMVVNNYNYVMNQYREENITMGVDATLPFRQVRDICESLDVDKLIEMAKKEGFRTDKFQKLSKNEMCALLAKHLLTRFEHIALLPVQ